MLLNSGVIANIFELSLISIIQSSRTSKLFSRTYIQQAAKEITQIKSRYLFHSLEKLFLGLEDAFV
jgi:hypothetical protein